MKLILLLSSALMTMLPASTVKINSTADNPVVSSVMIPFDDNVFISNGSSGESVHFTGRLHLSTKFQPGPPIRIFTNTVDLKGIGNNTGGLYKLVGSMETMQDVTAGSTFSFTHSYRLIPPNPVIPPNPIIPGNPVIPVFFTVNLSSDGSITDASATFNSTF